MNSLIRPLVLVFSSLILSAASHSAEPVAAERWSAEKANAWYDAQPWLVGANFVPSTAGNQLEMWQAETFDPATIDRELGWAAGLGMNTMRVFLHDIPWRADPAGFYARLDQFLALCAKHHIRPLLVIFDGVWHPFPKAGPQPAPVPGLHNSIWVQSPGRAYLEDPAKQDELQAYVTGLLTRYKDDKRILAWDLFNEPDNGNVQAYGKDGDKSELPPKQKAAHAVELLRKTFAWARAVAPSQPLTAGVWLGDYLHKPTPIQRLSLEQSDITSFHSYSPAAEVEPLITGLAALGRPVLCTEYMARGNGSTFAGLLPLFKKHRVAAYNWGFVDGRSQTIYPWDSWKKAYTTEPSPWFHDIFRRDGTPYLKAETDLIRSLTR